MSGRRFLLAGAIGAALAAAAFGSRSALLLAPARLRGDEAVPMKEVPEAVRSSAQQRYGALDGCKASREKSHGRTRWEIEKPVAGGGVESLLITDSGQVLEVERPIRPDQLQKEVIDALSRAYPGATIAGANSVERSYLEVSLQSDGKKREVKIDVDGALAPAQANAAEKRAKSEKEEDGDEDDDGD